MGAGRGLRDLSPPRLDPDWLPSSGKLALPPSGAILDTQLPLKSFSLGKAARRSPEIPPRPLSQAQPVGTKGIFSFCLGNVGRGAWQAAPAWPGGLLLWTRCFFFPFQPLDGCKARLLCRGRSQCWTLTLQQEDGCIWRSLPGLALGFPHGGWIWSHRGLCVKRSCFSPHPPGSHGGTPALRSICVSEP